MKKILYGSIVLCLFAIAITLTEIGCQKSIAQTTKPGDDNTHFILYNKTDEVKIPVVTQTDSGTNTTYLNYYATEYFTVGLDGNNEMKIPINLPEDLYVSSDAKLTSDGSTIVFNVYTKPTENDNSPLQCYIYSCSLDGSNLKKVRDNCGFTDVH